MTRGFTLLEVTVALVLVGVLADLSVRAVVGATDRWAVLAAREEVAALVSLARLRAVAESGAWFEVDEGRGLASIGSSAGDTSVVLGVRGVRVEVVGSATRFRYALNALGLGTVASRRLRFSRGEAAADLVFSAHGRVRRP